MNESFKVEKTRNVFESSFSVLNIVNELSNFVENFADKDFLRFCCNSLNDFYFKMCRIPK